MLPLATSAAQVLVLRIPTYSQEPGQIPNLVRFLDGQPTISFLRLEPVFASRSQ